MDNSAVRCALLAIVPAVPPGSVQHLKVPVSRAGSDGRCNTCLEFTRRSFEA
jgi:hypothetical protein